MSTPNSTTLRLGAVAALATLAALAAWAAEPPAPAAPYGGAPPYMMGGTGGMMGMGPGAMLGSPADTQKRLADAKRQLAIAADQEPAWKAYEQAVVEQSTLMNTHRQAMMTGGPPPVEQRLAMHQEGLKVMQRATQAAQDLYGVLTPEQRTKTSGLPLLDAGPGYGMWQATPPTPAAGNPPAQGN